MAGYFNLNLIRVLGVLGLPNGTIIPTPAQGTITFEFPAGLKPLRDSSGDFTTVPVPIVGSIVDGVITSKDQNGDVQVGIYVPATNDEDVFPTGFTYKVTLSFTNPGAKPYVFFATIPFDTPDGELEFDDIPEVQELPNVSGFVLVGELDDLIGAYVAAHGIGGGGDGTVTEINGHVGPIVTLSYGDVDADQAGSAATALAAANARLPLAGGTMLGPIELDADPVSAMQPSTKQYTDALAAGFVTHTSVATATTAALPACTYANGTAGVGATLTGNANGALGAIAGVTPAVTVPPMRILVKNQAAGLQDGIYDVTQVGSGGTPFILTRSTDADSGTSGAELGQGAYFLVDAGGTLAGSSWSQQTATPTIGTSPIVFGQVSGPTALSAGTGIAVAGTTVSIAAPEQAAIAAVATKAAIASPTFTGLPVTPGLQISGLPGATGGFRFGGFWTGPPSSGAWLLNDVIFVNNGSGSVRSLICTAAGTGLAATWGETGAAVAAFVLATAISHADSIVGALTQFAAGPGISSAVVGTTQTLSNDNAIVSVGLDADVTVVTNSSVLTEPLVGGDPALLILCAANTSYKVEGIIGYNGSSAAADVKFGFAIPVGAKLRWTPGGLGVGATVSSDVVQKAWVRDSVAVAVGAIAGADETLHLVGRLDTDATVGNISLRCAQSFATPGHNVKLLDGSVLMLTRLG